MFVFGDIFLTGIDLYNTTHACLQNMLYKWRVLFQFQIEDEMIQCCVCEDWFHSRVSISRRISCLVLFPAH